MCIVHPTKEAVNKNWEFLRSRAPFAPRAFGGPQRPQGVAHYQPGKGPSPSRLLARRIAQWYTEAGESGGEHGAGEAPFFPGFHGFPVMCGGFCCTGCRRLAGIARQAAVRRMRRSAGCGGPQDAQGSEAGRSRSCVECPIKWVSSDAAAWEPRILDAYMANGIQVIAVADPDTEAAAGLADKADGAAVIC